MMIERVCVCVTGLTVERTEQLVNHNSHIHCAVRAAAGSTSM